MAKVRKGGLEENKMSDAQKKRKVSEILDFTELFPLTNLKPLCVPLMTLTS